jgi:hypothetical protein
MSCESAAALSLQTCDEIKNGTDTTCTQQQSPNTTSLMAAQLLIAAKMSRAHTTPATTCEQSPMGTTESAQTAESSALSSAASDADSAAVSPTDTDPQPKPPQTTQRNSLMV